MPRQEPRLSFASYTVLALVGEGGAAVHDVARGVRQGGRLYGDMAPSQVYAEARRLADLGLLASRTEPGRTTPRTVYALTPAGRAALRDRLRRPSPFPRLRQEVTLRLLAGDMLGDDEIVASVTAIRADIAELSSLVDEMERGARSLPARERYLLLQHSLARRLLRAYGDWVDEVEDTLGAAPPDRTGDATA